jgi:hypothetical protein
MTTESFKLPAALTAALLGVGCASKTADLGNDPDASPAPTPSGPAYATTAPPATAGAVPTTTPWKLVEGSGMIQTFGVDQGEVFWLAPIIVGQEGPLPLSTTTGLALSHCKVDGCADTLQSSRVAETTWAADGTLPPLGLSSQFVFWPDGISVVDYCPRDNCASPSKVNPDSASGWTYVLDGPNLFLAGDGGLVRCAADNCNATLTPVPVELPDGVARLDSRNRIVADQDYLYTVNGYRILRMSKDGSMPVQVVVDGEAFIGDIAVSGDSVFWTEHVAFGSVKACPKTGCVGTPRILVSGLHLPLSLAADAERVYFTEPREASRALNQCSSPGFSYPCPPTTVPGSDRLSSCALGGCAGPTVLAENAGIAGMVLVDDRFVYVLGSDLKLEAELWVVNAAPQVAQPPEFWGSFYIAALPK